MLHIVSHHLHTTTRLEEVLCCIIVPRAFERTLLWRHFVAPSCLTSFPPFVCDVVGRCTCFPRFLPRVCFDVLKVELQVVLLTSTKTQIPFDYYHAPYCQPDKITKEAENLGEVRFRAPAEHCTMASTCSWKQLRHDVIANV